MFRRFSIGFTLLLLLAIATSAQAAAGHWMISAFGGAAVPSGDFSDENKLNASAGYQIGGSIDYALTEMFAIGLDGSYNKNKNGLEGETVTYSPTDIEKFDKAEFNTTQFGAHGKWMFPTKGAMGGYGLVGAGVYNTTLKVEGTETTTGTPFSGEDKTDARFGGRVGLGGSYKINEMWGIGAEADYNFISEEKSRIDASSLQYIGVHGMLTMHIMPK